MRIILIAAFLESIVLRLVGFDMRAILKQAWIWSCPKCGTTNSAEPVIAELLPSEKSDIREEHGFDDTVTGDFYTVPTVVECDECGREFDAVVAEIGDSQVES